MTEKVTETVVEGQRGENKGLAKTYSGSVDRNSRQVRRLEQVRRVQDKQPRNSPDDITATSPEFLSGLSHLTCLSLSVYSANRTAEAWCVAAVKARPHYHGDHDCTLKGAACMPLPAEHTPVWTEPGDFTTDLLFYPCCV